METVLILSSQGQVVIPSKVRKVLGVKPGSKLTLTLNKNTKIPSATLLVQPESWVALVTGLGKGIWGKGEKYIEEERKSWQQR